MSLYKRGGVWWVDLVHAGKRFRSSTGERDKAPAQRHHDELKAELWKRKRSGPTLHATLDAWGKGRDGPDKYRVKKLKELLDDRPLGDVDGEWIEGHLPCSSPGTFNRYLNVVNAALNRARKKGHMEKVPHVDPQKPPPGRTRWLTSEEWKTLRSELPEHQRPMADLAISTGMRQANVFGLEWSSVDLARKVAWVWADSTKSGKPLNIPLSDAAIGSLRAQEGKHARWVFPSQKDPEKHVVEIKSAWGKAVKRAKLEGFTWHGLRHTWATWHVMGGTPLEVLQKLGGWSDLRMVLRYAHLAESHIAQYANNARPYVTVPCHNDTPTEEKAA